MKNILIPIVCLSLAVSARAEDLFDQLVAFNPNWQSYESRLDYGETQYFPSDKEYIQTHLTHILDILKSNSTEHLTCQQYETRLELIAVLTSYKERGLFPMNYYRNERIPVFIDEHNTHCAVGYLLMETGFDDVAHRIAATNNYAWVKEIDDPELSNWQAYSGFTLEELKLIQGAYDFYDPFARSRPNRTEIPQAPSVVTLDFNGNQIEASPKGDELLSLWCYGEGKDGVLHGKWIQNYRDGIPWIEGYFENGNRTGSWKEYYQGTNILCRTEHWRNDKLNGVRTRYDRQGNVIERITFKEGEAIEKINYDLQGDLEYVRKPIDSVTLATEVYTLSGYLLAKGNEQISNPSGRLQWFQDIELTALNTFAITARDGAPEFTDGGLPVYQQSSLGGNQIHLFGGSGFQQDPVLVNYLKIGEWKFFNEYAAESFLTKAHSSNDYLTKDFPHFGNELTLQMKNSDIPCLQQSFDSIQVNYDKGRLKDLKGFTEDAAIRFGIVTEKIDLGLEYYDFYSNQSFNRVAPSYHRVVAMGEMNTNGDRIGDWIVFDAQGRPSRYVKYLQPFKEEEPLSGKL